MMKGKAILDDGRTIDIDISTLTQAEWREFWHPLSSDKKTDAVLARLTGLKPKEFGAMQRHDFRRIIAEILRLGNSPLSDPNSPSAST